MKLKHAFPTIARRALGLVAATTLSMQAEPVEPKKVLFDFTASSDRGAWEIVNDGVMGGLSRSAFNVTNGIAVFAGEVSLENNGGFASVRTRPAPSSCAGCEAFCIRVRGDGKNYRFTARTDGDWDSPIYQAGFETRAGEWQDIVLPFTDFRASFRGQPVREAPPLDPASLVSVGFLIADKQKGPFHLEIERIEAAKASGAGQP